MNEHALRPKAHPIRTNKQMLGAVKDAAQMLREFVLMDSKSGFPFLTEDDIPLERFNFDEEDMKRFSPHAFAQRQREHGHPKIVYRPSEAVIWPPSPFPPRRTKTQLLVEAEAVKTFSDVERFVRGQIPQPHESIDDFVETLTEKWNSDLLKLRAIFFWLATLDFDAIESSKSEVEPNSLLEILRNVREEKSISSVFYTLCLSAGLLCQMLIGYKKGANYIAGRRMKDTHKMGIWFAVFVDGEFRFVDAHWGCSENLNEYYFLTNPDDLIYSHWPLEKNWQLLVQPITFENFEELIYIQPEYFKEAGLQLASHPKGVINVPSYGQIEIQFHDVESHNNYFLKPFLLLKDLSSNGNQMKNDWPGDLNRYILAQRRSKSKLSFTISPPMPGKYIFMLLSLPKNAHHDTNDVSRGHMLLTYVLYAFKTSRYLTALPLALSFWGVMEPAPWGIRVSDLDGAEIHIHKGKADLKLTHDPAYQLQFKVQILKHSGEKTATQKSETFSVVPWRRSSNNICFHILSWSEGQAALNVSARVHGNAASSYTPVAHFLLRSERGAQLSGRAFDWQLPDNLLFGIIDCIRCHELHFLCKLPSADCPVILLTNDPSQNPLRLTWTVKNHETRFRCRLKFFNGTMIERSVEDCIYEFFTHSATLTFTESGIYRIEILEIQLVKSKVELMLIYAIALFVDLGGRGRESDEKVAELNNKSSNLVSNKSVSQREPSISVQPTREELKLEKNTEENDKCNSNTSQLSTLSPFLVRINSSATDSTKTTSMDLKLNIPNVSNPKSDLPSATTSNKQISLKSTTISTTTLKKRCRSVPSNEKEPAPEAEQTAPQKSTFTFGDISLKFLEYHLLLRRAVKKARVQQDREILSDALNIVRNSSELNFADLQRLQNDIQDVVELHARMERAERLCCRVLQVNNRALGELRSYNKPDPDIHTAVQATLLLLGHYEKRTRKWRRCQPLLKGIIQDIRQYDHSSTHPGLAARAAQLLRTVTEDEIALKSTAAAAFYRWSIGVVELLQNLCDSDSFVPAKLNEQRKLLKISAAEEADLEWEDCGALAKQEKNGLKFTR